VSFGNYAFIDKATKHIFPTYATYPRDLSSLSTYWGSTVRENLLVPLKTIAVHCGKLGYQRLKSRENRVLRIGETKDNEN